MEGVNVFGKLLHKPRIEVKSDNAGVWISAEDTKDSTSWIHVYITTAALWQLVNMQPGGGEFFIPPLPPLTPDEIDLTALPDPHSLPRVPLPPTLPPLPPIPPQG